MSTQIPTTEPRTIVIGETLRWTKTLDDYPASDGWVITYYFRGAGTGFNAVAIADGDDHAVAVPAATTARMTAGAYYWQAWAVLDGEKFVAGEGETTAVAGLVAVDDDTVVDNRSHVKKILDAIDARIEGRVTADIHMYMIGNRQLMKIPMGDLADLRKHYATLYTQELRRKRVRRGGTLFQTVKVRFDKTR